MNLYSLKHFFLHKIFFISIFSLVIFNLSLLYANNLEHEEIYDGYKSSSSMGLIKEQLDKRKGKALKSWVLFLAEKKNKEVSAFVVAYLFQRGELFLIYQTYFSPRLKTFYSVLYRQPYYQLLLSLRLEKELFQAILLRLAKNNSITSKGVREDFRLEDSFLEKLLSQTKQKEKLLAWLKSEDFPLDAEKKVIFEQLVYFYSGQWKNLYYTVKKTRQLQNVTNKTFFTQQVPFGLLYEKLQFTLLEKLYSQGYYEAFLIFGQTFPDFEKKFLEKIDKSLFFSKLSPSLLPKALQLQRLPLFSMKQAFLKNDFSNFLRYLQPRW